MANQTLDSFKRNLAEAGISTRTNWTASRLDLKTNHDISHVSFVGSGKRPAIGTGIIIDYGEDGGYGFYPESQDSKVAEHIATIAGSDVDPNAVCEKVGANIYGRTTEFLRLAEADDMAGARRELLDLLSFFDAEKEADTLHALKKAESFISGFEDDEMQEGIDEMLTSIRAAIEHETMRNAAERVDSEGMLLAAVEAWPQFDTTSEPLSPGCIPEESDAIDPAALVEWFGTWRGKVKAALGI